MSESEKQGIAWTEDQLRWYECAQTTGHCHCIYNDRDCCDCGMNRSSIPRKL